MSLDTYDNLKDEIIDWSHRDDMDLKIDTFINLAESEMLSNSIAPLKIRSQETRATASMDSTTPSRYLALPDGFELMRKLRIQITDGASIEINYRTPGQLNIISTVGLPRFFTVTDQLEFDRNPDIDYLVEMQYMKSFTGLSSANTTNTVLTNHPSIYLFGCMWALKKHVEQIQEAQIYYQQFIAAIKGANLRADSGRYGAAPVMRIEGATP